MAPDFALRDLEGRQVRLSDYRGRMPVIIEFGSMTCPLVTGRATQLDSLAEHYQGKIQFLFVYVNEEHPGHGQSVVTSYGVCRPLPQVRNYDERCERARLFQSTVNTQREILVDQDGADSVAARYGIHGHEFVIVDADGRICSNDLATQLHTLAGGSATQL